MKPPIECLRPGEALQVSAVGERPLFQFLIEALYPGRMFLQLLVEPLRPRGPLLQLLME
jgi:hypothetical protein